MASMAAGMGEPSCETIVDGVRITVHVPFEGPLSRTLAHRWIKPRQQFAVAQSYLFMTGIEPAPKNWKELLIAANAGANIDPQFAKKHRNLIRSVIHDWPSRTATAVAFQTLN
jgi:hypothetical protein